MDRWQPHEDVAYYLESYGRQFRGFTPLELYQMCELYKAPWFWMAGITLHEDLILFDDDVYDSPNKFFQALVVHHELVHVAQQKTMPQGVIGFYATYVWQWVTSGFSYKTMRDKGIEAEATRETDRFRQQLYGGQKVDDFYAARTSLMMYEWLKKEPARKSKRPRARKKPGKAR